MRVTDRPGTSDRMSAAKTAPRRKDASLARVERKAFYLLCYANALTDDTGDVARAATGEGEGEEGDEGALELARRWLAREMREAETRRETAAAAAAAPSVAAAAAAAATRAPASGPAKKKLIEEL